MSALLLGDDPKAVSKFIGDVDIITYIDIWNTLENKQNKAMDYFLELLRKIEEFKGGEVELFNVMTNSKSKVSGKVVSINQWENLCLMLATVLNLSLYLRPIEDLSPELQSRLTELKNRFQKEGFGKRRKLHPYIDEICINSIKLVLTGGSHGESAEMRSFLINQLSYTHDEISKDPSVDIFEHFTYKFSLRAIEQAHPPSIPISSYETGEFCFIYQYFKNIVSENNNLLESFLEDIIKKFDAIKRYFQEQPERAGKALLSIVILIRYILNKRPIRSPALMKRLISRFHFFIGFPDPIGTDCNSLYMQMVYEMNFPYINHTLYLRKNFPYLDYFNRYLQAKELESQSLDLRAIFYSDTSNLAYQILSQNSRRLRDKGNGFRSLDAHTIRCKMLFGMLTTLNNIVSDSAKKTFAERLVCAEPKAVFDMYKVICYYLEWLTNFPGNLFLQKEISEVAKELADKVRGTPIPEKMTANQISLLSKLSETSGFVTEDQLRHELISMNDYIRKNDKIVTDAIDDEMVVRDMMKYLELQMNWLEHKAEKVIDEIAEQDVREILTYLNTDILQKFKEKSLDYNSFTYAKTCKCLIVGGSSTFHEFIQPLILAMSSNDKSKIFNYVRIYVLSNSKDLSPLASYLSKKDHIYQRLMYLPSVVLPMYPVNADKHQLEYQSRVKRNIDVFGGFFSNEGKRLMPYEMLEDNIQTYLTEASHFFKLYIYEIAERRPRDPRDRELELNLVRDRRLQELAQEGEKFNNKEEDAKPYFSDSDSEESQSGKSNLYERMVNQNRFDDETGREQPLDLLIPFDEDTGKKIYMFNNIEIGVDVHNRVKSMQGHKLAAGVRFLNLKIEATLMDSKENIKAKKVRVEKTFGRIQLANLEKPRNWYGPEPCPYMKYLELSLLDEEGYTTIASKPPKGDFADVKSPYEALHLNLRISEVKITAVNEEDKFYLLVDSNYYGPFKSIHIRPMHIIWKKHLFLPIMHFTPFSELNY